MTPRHHRLLQALMHGPITREQVDAITGASNGPDEVLQARRLYRLTIPCHRHSGLDRDRHRVEFGTYRLTRRDRARVATLLREVKP